MNTDHDAIVLPPCRCTLSHEGCGLPPPFLDYPSLDLDPPEFVADFPLRAQRIYHLVPQLWQTYPSVVFWSSTVGFASSLLGLVAQAAGAPPVVVDGMFVTAICSCVTAAIGGWVSVQQFRAKQHTDDLEHDAKLQIIHIQLETMKIEKDALMARLDTARGKIVAMQKQLQDQIDYNRGHIDHIEKPPGATAQDEPEPEAEP